MKYFLSLVLFLSIFVNNLQAQCDSVTNKILMIGDSWADFPFGFGSIENNLDRFGYTNVGLFSNSNLSISGAETVDFLTPAAYTAIQNAFLSNPDIEMVNLSIGGNDILRTWHKSMDSLQTDSILTATMTRTDSIIDIIKSLKPNVEIYLPGYDFANFGEIIETFIIPATHPFYSSWNNMGKPDFVQMNKLLSKAENKINALASGLYKVQHNNPLGLMQYIYGQTTALGIAPGGTYLPGSVTFPGGRLDYPSPKVAMNDYILFKDCFHLNSEGFDFFYKYHFEHYFWNELRRHKDITFVSEGGLKDGGVSSTSIISSSNVTIGNSSIAGITKGIVSFNTGTIPNANQIHDANIFLYRDNQTGTLPAFNKVILEIKKGNFGTSATVDFGDYTSSADAKDSACVYGSAKENGFWLRINVPSSLLPEINKTGTTQFRIAMIDSTDGNIFYFSTGDSTNKPTMDVEYYNPASISSIENEASLVLFPNPTNENWVNVKNLNDFKGNVHAFDIAGRAYQIELRNSQLNIASLAQGTYFIVFENEQKKIVQKLIKQ